MMLSISSRSRLLLSGGRQTQGRLRHSLGFSIVMPGRFKSSTGHLLRGTIKLGTKRKGLLSLPILVGAGGFYTSAKAEPTQPPTKEMSLTEALAELNSAINSLLLKMQQSYPEMADAGLLWLLGLRALAMAHEAQAKLNPFMGESAASVPDAPETAKQIRRYGALAEAVYETTEGSFWEFLTTTARPYVNREDYQIVTFVPSAEFLAPAHAVLLDHRNKEILVCVRGTKSVHDLLTDVGMESAPFLHSYGHGSIVKATENTMVRVVPTLEELRKLNPGYTVVCFGHSLGAGVAVMLAFLLRDRGIENVKAISFAAPACLSPELSSEAGAFTTAVVLGDDIIPRASVSAMLRLIKDIRHMTLEEQNAIHTQAWDQLDGLFKQLEQYDWFRSTMKTFLASEEISLQRTLETVNIARVKLEEQIGLSITEIQQQYNKVMDDFSKSAGDVGEEIKKSTDNIAAGLIKSFEDISTTMVSQMAQAINAAAPYLLHKRYRPYQPQADGRPNTVQQLEVDKEEVQQWLKSLQSPKKGGEQLSEDMEPLQPLDQRLLCTPNTIHHIMLRQPDSPSETADYAMFKCEYPVFSGIIVSPHMLLHHRMAHYNIALDQLLSAAAQSKPETGSSGNS